MSRCKLGVQAVWLVALLSMGSGPVLSTQEDLVGIAEKVKPSVLTVLACNEGGQVISQGSGFFIATDRLVTSRHVIQGADHAQIITASGKSFPVRALLAEDKEGDLVLLSVDVPRRRFNPLELAKTLPKTGQQILVVGSPLGLEQTVSSGIVSSIRHIPGIGDLIQITAPISPGSSGGPVIDRKGHVVGVVVSQSEITQNLHFAITTARIKGMKAD